MKVHPVIVLVLLQVACSVAIGKERLDYRVVVDKRLYLRDANDNRGSVWTALPNEVDTLLGNLGVTNTHDVFLGKGETLAIFFNDKIEEDLIAVTRIKEGNEYFAEYADSGLKLKIERRSHGVKLTHVTVVILNGPTDPQRLVSKEVTGRAGPRNG
jgi:hypothetical protein